MPNRPFLDDILIDTYRHRHVAVHLSGLQEIYRIPPRVVHQRVHPLTSSPSVIPMNIQSERDKVTMMERRPVGGWNIGGAVIILWDGPAAAWQEGNILMGLE